MIKVNLPILMAKKGCRSIAKVSKETGISRTTLTTLYYGSSCGIQYDTLDRLCTYFGCDISDILNYSQ